MVLGEFCRLTYVTVQRFQIGLMLLFRRLMLLFGGTYVTFRPDLCNCSGHLCYYSGDLSYCSQRPAGNLPPVTHHHLGPKLDRKGIVIGTTAKDTPRVIFHWNLPGLPLYTLLHRLLTTT